MSVIDVERKPFVENWRRDSWMIFSFNVMVLLPYY
jgi:hypothetical protein